MSTTVFTDHKPIVSAFNSNKPRSSDRQQRKLSFISEYITDIVYIASKANVVADALFRSENAQLSNLTQFNHETDSLDLIAIARAQAEQPELYADYVKTDIGLPNINLFCETSQPNPRPVIPKHLRRGIFDLLHGMCHTGIKATTRIINTRYFWHNIKEDVRKWCTECQKCQ